MSSSLSGLSESGMSSEATQVGPSLSEVLFPGATDTELDEAADNLGQLLLVLAVLDEGRSQEATRTESCSRSPSLN